MRFLPVALLATVATVTGASHDTFNYGGTTANNYGPSDWGRVTCDDVTTCVSHIALITTRTKRAVVT